LTPADLFETRPYPRRSISSKSVEVLKKVDVVEPGDTDGGHEPVDGRGIRPRRIIGILLYGAARKVIGSRRLRFTAASGRYGVTSACGVGRQPEGLARHARQL
jgi:hypothetical protein